MLSLVSNRQVGPCGSQTPQLQASATTSFININNNNSYPQCHIYYIDCHIKYKPITMKSYQAFGGGSAQCFFIATLFCTLLHPGSAQQPQSQVPLTGFNPSSKLDWKSCGELVNHTLECKHSYSSYRIQLIEIGTRLDVPMDHFNKSSDKTFNIPLIRMLGYNASNNGNKTILLNPGGPGGILCASPTKPC
jgi:hypothetical protein